MLWAFILFYPCSLTRHDDSYAVEASRGVGRAAEIHPIGRDDCGAGDEDGADGVPSAGHIGAGFQHEVRRAGTLPGDADIIGFQANGGDTEIIRGGETVRRKNNGCTYNAESNPSHRLAFRHANQVE